MRRWHRCPRCDRLSVRRVGTGIWKCLKCDLVFSGGAYVPHTPAGVIATRTIKRLSEAGESAVMPEEKEEA